MRGEVTDTDIEGTSKGAEGYAAGIAYSKAKEKGMNIEIQRQDGDSSATKSFKEHYLTGEVMLCGVHVARAHTNGHSNYPKAFHNVLVRFLSKGTNTHCVHYMTTTNLGLYRANMSWLYEKKGLSYHWILDLFAYLRLFSIDTGFSV